MTCPECGSENVNQLVNVMIECPVGYRKLDKSGIRSKLVTVWAADWAGAILACRDCGWMHHGQSREKAADE